MILQDREQQMILFAEAAYSVLLRYQQDVMGLDENWECDCCDRKNDCGCPCHELESALRLYPDTDSSSED